MTCKDCLHYEVCQVLEDNGQVEKIHPRYCGCFVDRSKFVELPCKVGDIVYITGEKYPCEITEVVIDECGTHFNWISYKKSYDLTEFWHDGDFSVDDINKTVFLTFKEAEKALEKYKK